MANQDEDFKWFNENKDSLYKQYPETFLIISNKEVKGTAKTGWEALMKASKILEPGSYIVQECTSRDTTVQYVNFAVSFA